MNQIRYASALALLCGAASLGQTVRPVTLQVDTSNWVSYEGDVFDYSKFATSPTPVPASPRKTFSTFIAIADIVNINGKAAKGTLVFRTNRLYLSPAPVGAPGFAIADVTRATIADWVFEIMQPDGTPIGTFMALGLANGSPPPGAPRGSTGYNFAIAGGTGAFLGARGQMTAPAAPFTLPAASAVRSASLVEDPGMRRANGGINSGFFIQFTPAAEPAILDSNSAPAIVHAGDSSLVTPANPAKAGEVLTLYATGLGPTKTLLNPGEVFPSSPLALVNSPVNVLVGDASAEILYAGGVPGTVDAYQVNFRLPSGLPRGTAALHLEVAYVAGPARTLAVQ